ncbi:hypothetical protein BCR35DRAFT_328893 [Leucosporidium creatinivorum]|uniref:F-box domain-containing protein n=1 Tax=Leucosporidium creatinivorum TaxID=106004 RepID=A0A1Y2G0U5_9BASI|nr:hypothetical protein BCR35DRAFT_328893 [Leucosporidium creatinivorum]
MPISSLPPELLVAIAEQVDAGPWDRQDLYRFCLVSRAWEKAARLELYRRVGYRSNQSRAAQLARTIAARHDLARAVREMQLSVGLDGSDHTTELTRILEASSRVVNLAVAARSEPLPVFAALTAALLPNLKELEVQEPLASKRELSAFSTLLKACPILRSLHFDGLYFAPETARAELQDLEEAAKHHSLLSLQLGVACTGRLPELFIPPSCTTLQRLSVEITVSVGPSHLESLTGLQSLELYTGFLESAENPNVNDASITAKTILERCSALPSLRSVTLNLNWEGDYYVNGNPPSSFAYEYIIDIETLHALPPTLATLEINDSLVNADEFLTFLDSTHRPPSLSFIKIDLFWEMFRPSKLKPVLRRLHSLGLRYEIAPFEVYFYDEDDEDDLGYTCDEVKSAGPVLKWDGGDWSGPELESEVEDGLPDES